MNAEKHLAGKNKQVKCEGKTKEFNVYKNTENSERSHFFVEL